MYILGVKRDFIARHFLIGGDWGPENFPNSHHYVLELQLEGKELDQHGYLVDIVDVDRHLDEIVSYYKEQMLNEKPEFTGLNPSIGVFRADSGYFAECTYPSRKHYRAESYIVGKRVRLGSIRVETLAG